MQFGEADLQGKDFKGQDLRRSNFTSADCRRADFSNAKLQGAYFMKAVAFQTNFEGANLSDVLMGARAQPLLLRERERERGPLC